MFVHRFAIRIARPCAIHVPSHARRIGSSAVTNPLAGTCTSIPFRAARAYKARGWKRRKANPAAALHARAQPLRRPQRIARLAQTCFFLGGARASDKLRAKFTTSCENGARKSSLGSFGRGLDPAARRSFIHCAVREIGRTTVQRMIRTVTKTISSTCAITCHTVSRQIRSLCASI